MEKSDKTSKHTNKLHKLYQNAIKINILKLSSNEKIVSFVYLMWGILKKINQNKDANKLSVGWLDLR